MRRTSDRRGQAGFTLVEMIVAITITAILSGIVVLFIKVPLDSYFDVSRRAELTDAADLAVRRIAREVQGALPNSVRVSTVAGVTYLEFLAVRTGGRYREQPAGTCPGGNSDELEIGLSDTCFRTLGDIAEIGQIVAGSDSLVVYNLGAGHADADAYVGANRVPVATATDGAGSETFTFAAKTFPLASPSRRFFVVSGPVTYACDPTAGNQVLRRHWGYAIAAAQPTPPAGGATALLASGVTACNIAYSEGAGSRNGVVSVNLTLTRTDAGGNAENVTLYAQAHVVNSP
ncbi:MAG: prepilin-type N-terminal cleavage/methylation domain-containing protein [Denitratisoma sp.]|nr:prepilin-type N-terminal cleavage/methylation domain-containing protein [Denitratisoma sp.]